MTRGSEMSRGQSFEYAYMKEWKRQIQESYERELAAKRILPPRSPKKSMAPTNSRARKMRFD